MEPTGTGGSIVLENRVQPYNAIVRSLTRQFIELHSVPGHVVE